MPARSDEVREVFGRVLKEARSDAGLTQAELAAGSHFESVYVSNLESGKYQPSLTALLAFESVLELPPGTLSERTAQQLTAAYGQFDFFLSAGGKK